MARAYENELGSIRTDRGEFIDKGNVVLNVRHADFNNGAKGDGATDDGIAFNKAVEHLPTEGGTVLVPPGDYLLTTAFTFNSQDNIVLWLMPGVVLTGSALPTATGNNFIMDWRAGIAGNFTGNAATATALETARTINSVSFDGTANITVTAAAGTLTGATLASGVTASSLTSLGTIASLVATTADINAGTVDAVIGGTTPAAGSFTTVTTSTSVTTPFIALGVTPPSAGSVRIGNGGTIQFNNNADSANLEAVSITSADILELGADTAIASILIGAAGVGATIVDDLQHDGANLGVYGTTAIAQQTGVAVSAAGVHAACVALGLFTA